MFLEGEAGGFNLALNFLHLGSVGHNPLKLTTPGRLEVPVLSYLDFEALPVSFSRSAAGHSYRGSLSDASRRGD